MDCPSFLKSKLCSLVLAFTVQKVWRRKVRGKDNDDMCAEILRLLIFCLSKNRKMFLCAILYVNLHSSVLSRAPLLT